MPAAPNLLQCRICNGPRPTNGKVCLGCGTPVANATPSIRPRVQTPRVCPKCGSRRYIPCEDQRFECVECSSHFEDADFGFLDTRPVENAMKRESGRRVIPSARGQR